jgi:hypothetical protein
MSERDSIDDFILRQVAEHPRDLTALIAQHFDISRQAALKRIAALVDAGDLTATGTTRSRVYRLAQQTRKAEFQLSNSLEEHRIWDEVCRPLMTDLPGNVSNVCNYGFTEMCNNAIDHSEGRKLSVGVVRSALLVVLWVGDDGVGIFRKISQALDLNDEREAILELAKGKLTTDSAHHSGEGVFFTSRMFDTFELISHHLHFTHRRAPKGEQDWLTEGLPDNAPGTDVQLAIATDSATTTKAVFDRYSLGEDYTFSRTHVPVTLAQYGDTNLVSRSQAKRVLARFQRFTEVCLDFAGVPQIGQGFADEIFRVFRAAHPEIELRWENANPDVEWMIRRAWSGAVQAREE